MITSNNPAIHNVTLHDNYNDMELEEIIIVLVQNISV